MLNCVRDESSVILRALCVSVVFSTTEPRRAQSDTEALLRRKFIKQKLDLSKLRELTRPTGFN